MAKAYVGSYRCKACGTTFRSKKEFQAHNNKAHGGKSYGILIHEKK